MRSSVLSAGLARALAERLTAVVPPGFEVRARDAVLVMLHNDAEVGRSGAPAVVEDAGTAVRAALSAVQDYVADVTAEPWPGTGADQPNADARVEGAVVRMWFGPEHAPVLELPPISVPQERPAP